MPYANNPFEQIGNWLTPPSIIPGPEVAFEQTSPEGGGILHPELIPPGSTNFAAPGKSVVTPAVVPNLGPAPNLIPSHTPLTLPVLPSIPPTPGAGGGLIPSQGVVQTPRNAADLARADAMAEWEAHKAAVSAGKKPADSGFGLSPLFFAQHPEVSGGVFVGPNGPQFLFNDNKPKDTMGAVNDLIRQYTDRISTAMGQSSGNPLYDSKVVNTLITQLSGILGAQTGASKAPSEIAQNTANANRPVVTNVPVGNEGRTGAFSIVPGQSPQMFATGMPASTIPKQTPQDYAINHLLTAVAPEVIKRAYDFTLPEKDRTQAMAQYKGIMQYAENLMTQGKPGTANSPVVGQGPKTWTEYYTWARQKGIPEDQILREGTVLLQQGKLVK